MTEQTITERVAHTPGPWRYEMRDVSSGSEPTLIGYVSAAPSDALRGLELAVLYGDQDGEREANARLIAAAPDLLAALKKAAHVFRRCELDPVDDSYTSILEQAEMAIAKAEGR